jgi:hypothetical protein
MKYLYIELRKPFKITIDNGYTNEILYAKSRGVVSGLPPWPAFPDLLIDLDTRELLGVVHFFIDTDVEAALSLAATIDESLVHIIKNPHDKYPGYVGDPKLHALELRWSTTRGQTTVECAQLLNDWYYRTGSAGLPNQFVGYGIHDVDDLVRHYNLTFPLLDGGPTMVRTT